MWSANYLPYRFADVAQLSTWQQLRGTHLCTFHRRMYMCRYAQGSRRLVVQVKVHVVVSAEHRYNETSRNVRPIGLRSFVRQTSSLPSHDYYNVTEANLSCHYTFHYCTFRRLYYATSSLKLLSFTFLFVKFEILFVNKRKKLIYSMSRNSRVILLQHETSWKNN